MDWQLIGIVVAVVLGGGLLFVVALILWLEWSYRRQRRRLLLEQQRERLERERGERDSFVRVVDEYVRDDWERRRGRR